MAIDTFSAEESGTGSRPTPLIDAPAWLKVQATREAEAAGDRATLTPDDHAFLESAPAYEQAASLAPPPEQVLQPRPSGLRRALSLLLFVTIAGSASAVLALAVLRFLGRALPW